MYAHLDDLVHGHIAVRDLLVEIRVYHRADVAAQRGGDIFEESGMCLTYRRRAHECAYAPTPSAPHHRYG